MDSVNYSKWTHNLEKIRFRANYGKGMLEFPGSSVDNIYMNKYDEHLTITKPVIQCKNIIFGGMFVDVDG